MSSNENGSSGMIGRFAVWVLLLIALLCFAAVAVAAANLAALQAGQAPLLPVFQPSATMIYRLAGAGLAALVLTGVVLIVRDSRAAAVSDDHVRQDRDQEAILRLLDEMGALAEGDLTIEATVTEDMTGAIADSMNYTIEALRGLVTTIDQTAKQVATTSDESLTTARELAEASRTQTEQIVAATEAIRKMVGTIQSVSADARRAAEVTDRSVAAAHSGGEAVRESIDGIGSVREQIEDTARRIKRLGESSQEIGATVVLINDIAEQTNILALNASIQAASAGEAGHGFAVVADEVQRLAERAGDATRQIEALVRTIQADANEAALSMEKSTEGVASGGQLVERAGIALTEIEDVSGQTAELVNGIAERADAQSAEARQLSETMASIGGITERTASGTEDSAGKIAELAALGQQLRESVSGFTLPERSE